MLLNIRGYESRIEYDYRVCDGRKGGGGLDKFVLSSWDIYIHVYMHV